MTSCEAKPTDSTVEAVPEGYARHGHVAVGFTPDGNHGQAAVITADH